MLEEFLVPVEGFEPPTLDLQNRRSGQLSYTGTPFPLTANVRPVQLALRLFLGRLLRAPDRASGRLYPGWFIRLRGADFAGREAAEGFRLRTH